DARLCFNALDAHEFLAFSMNATTQAAAADIEAEAQRARALLEKRDFAQALLVTQALLAARPHHRDALYMAAVSLRYLKRIPEALTTLEELEKWHPRFSRLYQERGYCFVAQRDAPRAIEAFESALRLNAALPASWNRLEALYRLIGKPADAERAAAQGRRIAAIAPEVVAAEGLFSEGDLADAEEIVRRYLQSKNPLDPDGMWLLAKIGMKLNILDDAEVLLETVLKIKPDDRVIRHDYAIVLALRHKHQRALEEVGKLLAADPKNRAFRTTHAAILMGLGRHDAALPLYREVLAETPHDPDLHLSIAHALKTLNRSHEAMASYRAASALRPSYGEAYWSFANLKKYPFTDEEVATMRVEEERAQIELPDRYHLCFALGKALEDRGQYEAAFGYYERGNALKKSETRYKPGSIEYNTRLVQQTFTGEFFATRRGWGCQSPGPIFIVGLPRSGSTLIEQILASHSQVEGTMELSNIPRLVQSLQGRDNYDSYKKFWDQYIAAISTRGADEFRRDGAEYLAETQIYRVEGKPFFTDKNPNNFRNIGLLQLILPNAKIIDARRGAMACCFSNYKQLFATGQEFSYSLEDLGSYYRWYIELMEHWDRVLPGKVLCVQHEQLVDDLEANVRRILDFCGLEFEPACLEYWKTERRIHTVSSEQVRRPVSREGIDQWRHFEPWLGPLRQALGSLADLPIQATPTAAETVERHRESS
ncbi:MAG TPA: sulfotransferase, partial [Steroidobacteraceae bacterium]|nr:sulfotransferase [Steroidobacteraceae bacterium]